MHNPIEPAIDSIVGAFFPRPIVCRVNGKLFLIERIGAEWTWRNEDGDTQEDYGIEPFAEAWQAQQGAINFVTATRRVA